MCREGAWVELTIEVTSVEDGTTQIARIFLYPFLEKGKYYIKIVRY